MKLEFTYSVLLNDLIKHFLNYNKASCAHKRVTANSMSPALIPTRGNEIINILIFSFWCRGKARR